MLVILQLCLYFIYIHLNFTHISYYFLTIKLLNFPPIFHQRQSLLSCICYSPLYISVGCFLSYCCGTYLVSSIYLQEIFIGNNIIRKMYLKIYIVQVALCIILYYLLHKIRCIVELNFILLVHGVICSLFLYI